jgi:ACR3 family arsenite efflux pump ArsB
LPVIGFGKRIFREYIAGMIFLGIALLEGAVIYWNLSRTGSEKTE